jgi:DNA primase
MGMKAPITSWSMTVSGPRVDWDEVKARVDIAAVATNLLGPAHQRRGRKLLWPCPFHDDDHPSFEVDLIRKSWRCWVCAIGGDAAELVKRVNKCDFPDAVKFLADLSGALLPSGTKPSRPAHDPVPVKAPERPADQPSGLLPDEASALVQEAAECLWTPVGKRALDYLHDRGLVDETIKVGPGLMQAFSCECC